MDNEEKDGQSRAQHDSGDGSASRPDPVGSNDGAPSLSQIPSMMPLGAANQQQRTDIPMNSELLQQLSPAHQHQQQQPLSAQAQNGLNQLNYLDFLSAINTNLIQQRDLLQPTTAISYGIQFPRGVNTQAGRIYTTDNLNLRQQLEQDRPTINSPSFLALRTFPGNLPNNPLVHPWSHQSVTATTVSSSVEDSVSQDSASRSTNATTARPSRLPCRARGMSEDHDFNSAFFDISPSTKHGDGLICSFEQCRKDGIKFLYCEYCRDAVGKRVFRNQHHHLDDVEAVQRAAGVAASARGAEIATPSAEPGAAMQEVNVRFIACRARGMPAEHDFKRAYFVITGGDNEKGTSGTKHGDGLVCSFPQCRNSGIKFRYCRFCDDAIARRNFKRHQHSNQETQKHIQSGLKSSHPQNEKGDSKPEKDGPATSSDSSGSEADVSDELDVEDSERQRISSADSTLPKSQNTLSNNRNSHISNDESEEGGGSQAATGRVSDNAVTAAEQSGRVDRDGHQSEDRQPSSKRRDLWATLLTKRPSQDGRAMRKWLEKIQSVSNLNIPDEALGISEEPSSSD